MSSDILFSMALVVPARTNNDCLPLVIVLMSTPCGTVFLLALHQQSTACSKVLSRLFDDIVTGHLLQ